MRVPSRVELAADAVVLHWPDGSDSPNTASQRLSHRTLRDACPCAACRRRRSEASDDAATLARDVVTVTGIQPMGYGVQLLFSDGHDRGIFPWAYLEALPAMTETQAETPAETKTDSATAAATATA